MAKDTDSLDLTDRQKMRLFDLALSPPDPAEPRAEDEEKGDLLHNILRCSLPLRTAPHEGPHGAATASCRGLRSVAGPPCGELLQDPKTSVDLLKEIKQYAKARGSQVTSEREKDVFLAIYFAAIAAALVYQGKHITEHADADLVRFFTSFGLARWGNRDLRTLFQKAVAYCRQQRQAGTP